MIQADRAKYSLISDEEALSRIQTIKKDLGKRLLFLAHNYQSRAIFELADHTGDSLELSKIARDAKDAEYIVFSAVHFMAETARILARDYQRVFLPNRLAGCPMADMAEAEEAEHAWQAIQNILPGEVIPVTYVNSTAELKAFCGREGGVAVTSGNAQEVFRWAYQQKKVILFFPDEYLGRNTGNALGIPKTEQVLWDPKASGEMGGARRDALKKSRLILWKGYCHVHMDFTAEDVQAARRTYPQAIVIVHPECREEVVAAADKVGSTKYMQDYVTAAPSGTEIILGTEVNHALNLAFRNPTKKIMPLLTHAICPNMYKTSLKHVLFTLENLPNANEITVPASVQKLARLALERMFQATP